MATGPILVLEDDENDALLLQRALHRNGIKSPVIVLPNGCEGIAYLSGEGSYQDRQRYPFPSVLIVDIKMPKMGGLDFLQWLKTHEEFQVIPTLVLSSSKLEQDVRTAYRLGASSYLVKPSSFDDFQRLVKTIYEYWRICVLPANKKLED